MRRFKTTFSNCKTIFSVISIHRKKKNITEMNYNKNWHQFILEKRILYQDRNKITALIKNKICITSRSFLSLKKVFVFWLREQKLILVSRFSGYMGETVLWKMKNVFPESRYVNSKSVIIIMRQNLNLLSSKIRIVVRPP